MVMNNEPGPGVYDDRMALTCLAFSLEHIPQPMEDAEVFER
jgi:hypothetical protein